MGEGGSGYVDGAEESPGGRSTGALVWTGGRPCARPCNFQLGCSFLSQTPISPLALLSA